jgi:hypothetical protein
MAGDTPIQGSSTLNTIVAGRVKIDRSELIEYVHPDNAPYFVLYSMLGYEPCAEEKFEWFKERGDFQSVVTVSAAASDSATTVVLSGNDYKRVVKKQVLFCPRTGEHMRLTATPSSSSISVLRDISGANAAALVVGDKLFVAPTVMEYGSAPVDVVSLEPTTDYNYVEYNRKGWKVDGRAQAVQLYGPNALDYAKSDNVRAFMREQELKFLFGTRQRQSEADGTRTYSGGVKYFGTAAGSSALQYDWSGKALTKSQFDDVLQNYFAQCGGPKSKLMICGWNMIRIINGWGWNKLTYNDKYQQVGLTVRRYESDFGIIDLLPHQLWNTELGMESEAWIVDLDSLKRRGLPGRSDITMTVTRGSNELQALGEDSLHQELGVEDGLEVRHTERFAFFTGIYA